MFVHANESFVSGEPISAFQVGESRRKRTIINRLDLSDTEYIEDSTEIENHVYEHFREMYSQREETLNTEFHMVKCIPDDSRANAKCMDPISTEEIYFAIKGSASKKSAGPDGLPKGVLR